MFSSFPKCVMRVMGGPFGFGSLHFETFAVGARDANERSSFGPTRGHYSVSPLVCWRTVNSECAGHMAVRGCSLRNH